MDEGIPEIFRSKESKELGIAENDADSFNEIFITSFKYMRIWTNKLDLVLAILNNFGIQYVENLQFIDEFPVVSETLSKYTGMRHFTEVIEDIENEFDNFDSM